MRINLKLNAQIFRRCFTTDTATVDSVTGSARLSASFLQDFIIHKWRVIHRQAARGRALISAISKLAIGFEILLTDVKTSSREDSVKVCRALRSVSELWSDWGSVIRLQEGFSVKRDCEYSDSFLF